MARIIASNPIPRARNSSLQFVAISTGVSAPAQSLSVRLRKRRQAVAGAPAIAPSSDSGGKRADIVVGHDRNAGGERRRVGEVGTASPLRANKRQTTGER